MTRTKRVERDAWQQTGIYRIASFMLLLQHVLVAACAMFWFVSPSASIEVSLDPAWSGSWSALFLVFSIIGGAARIKRVAKIEAASNIVIAISVWLWAMTIIITTTMAEPPNGGLQTGFMLLAFAANLWGWSLIQIGWTQRRETEAERLKREVAKLLADERERLARPDTERGKA